MEMAAVHHNNPTKSLRILLGTIAVYDQILHQYIPGW